MVKILSYLEDAPRPGTPKTFTFAQTQQIIALACQKPTEHGINVVFDLFLHQSIVIGSILLKIGSPNFKGMWSKY